MLKLIYFLFESIGIVDLLCEVFFKYKRLSAVWYDLGFDIRSLNMAACSTILIFFWAIYVL